MRKIYSLILFLLIITSCKNLGKQPTLEELIYPNLLIYVDDYVNKIYDNGSLKDSLIFLKIDSLTEKSKYIIYANYAEWDSDKCIDLAKHYMDEAERKMDQADLYTEIYGRNDILTKMEIKDSEKFMEKSKVYQDSALFYMDRYKKALEKLNVSDSTTLQNYSVRVKFEILNPNKTIVTDSLVIVLDKNYHVITQDQYINSIKL